MENSPIDFVTSGRVSEFGAATTAHYSEWGAQEHAATQALDANTFRTTDSRGTFTVTRTPEGLFIPTFEPSRRIYSPQVQRLYTLPREQAIKALQIAGNHIDEYLDIADYDALKGEMAANGFEYIRRFVNGIGSTRVFAFNHPDTGAKIAIRVASVTGHRHIEEAIAAGEVAQANRYDNYAPAYAASPVAQVFPMLEGDKDIIDVKSGRGGSFGFQVSERIETKGGIMLDIVESRGDERTTLTEVLANL